MSTILRTPAHNPGLTTLHNSYALAAFSPIIFEWTRRDYELVSVAENGGRSNQLDIVVAGDLTTEITDGGTLWLESTGFYSGLVTVIGTSYSAPNTTITTTALKNAGAVAEFEFINLISDRPNYRQLVDFIGVNEATGASTGSISTATITPGPGPLFRMSIDAGPFIRSEFSLLTPPDWTTSTRHQRIEELGFLFYVSYSELWTGGSPSASITSNFLALPMAKGSRDRYGESGIDLEVWENSLADAYKPVLSNALPNPVYFRGYPFFGAFGFVPTDEPTWQLIQNNTFDATTTPSTQSTTAFLPDAGFHLLSPQDVSGDLRQLQMWIEAGIFWSFFTRNEYGVDPYFLPGVNYSAGTVGNWLFEDGSQTTGLAYPLPGDTTGLDGTLQEVKVTGITADLMQQFSCLYDNNIAETLSFAPCSLLSSIIVQNQTDMTQIIGPTTTATNITQVDITDNTGLTSIDFSGAAILSGSFIIDGNTDLTVLNLPTVSGYTFNVFKITGCTSFTAKIALGVKFGNLMGINGSAVDLTGNGWDAATVDYYLLQLDEACPYGFTGRTIDISGNTAPTAASVGYLVSLAAKGVTVTTD